MINPWLGIAGVTVALCVLIVALRFVRRRWQPPAELTRKTAHIVMGLVCLSFPWLFPAVWPVLVIGGVSLGIMLWLRGRKGDWGQVIHGVKRRTYGELAYPVAVMTLHVLAKQDGEWILFVVPILLLTLADVAGAIIGLRYGTWRYTTDGGKKSFEGSLAFFLAAFLSTHIPLLLFTDIGRAECLLVGLIVGIITMIVEAFSWAGLDNLFMPLGAYLVLRTYPQMTAEELLISLGVLIGLVVLQVVLTARTRIRNINSLTVGLILYFYWTVADWRWAVPLLLLSIGYRIFCHLAQGQWHARHNIGDIGAVNGGGFIWFFLAFTLDTELYAPFALSYVAQLAVIVVAYNLWKHPSRRPWRLILQATLVPTTLIGLGFGVQYALGPWLEMVGLAVGVAFLTALAFWLLEWRRLGTTLAPNRAVRQLLYGNVFAAIGWLLLLL